MKLTKLVALLLALVMVFGVMAGCAKQEPAPVEKAEEAPAAETKEEPKEEVK